MKSIAIAVAALLAIAYACAWLSHRRNPELWRTDCSPRLESPDTVAILALRYSPDGSRLIAVGAYGEILELDADTGSLLIHRPISSQRESFTCASLTSDCSRLATGDESGLLKVWDVRAGSVLWESREHSDGIRCLDISANDQKLITAGGMRQFRLMDNDVRVWDMKTGTLICRLPNNAARVAAVSMNQDGSLAAVSNVINGKNRITLKDDCKIRVWSVETGEEMRQCSLLDGDCESLAFTDGDRHILIAGSGAPKHMNLTQMVRSLDPSARAIDLATSETFGIFNEPKTEFGPFVPYYVHSFEDSTIACWNNGNSLSFWNSKNTRLLSYSIIRAWDIFQMPIFPEWPFTYLYRGYDWGFPFSALSPDGMRLALANHEGVVSVWDLREALPAIQ